MSKVKIRKLLEDDLENLFELYQCVSAQPGGLARTQDEIDISYIKKILTNATSTGLALVAYLEEEPQTIVGAIHASKLGPKVFDHILGDLTILVSPLHQGKKVGKRLFTEFLNEVEKHHTDILRVELIVRESNLRAIKLYESLGFSQEGRLEKRICNDNGAYEADIPMGWLNPNFEK